MPTTSLSTGLFFDSRCLLHQANYDHLEGPRRVVLSFQSLVNNNLWDRCSHLQLEGSSCLDIFDSNDAKMVYALNTPGLVDSVSAADHRSQQPIEPIYAQLPSFSSHIAPLVHSTCQPKFTPIGNAPYPLVTDETLALVHNSVVINMIKASEQYEYGPDEEDSESEDDESFYPDCQWINMDTFVNRYTSSAARTAVSGVVRLTDAVCQGYIQNGFALIRPPGHHAGLPNDTIITEETSPDEVGFSGFCLYNNIAIAARAARRDFAHIGKILIFDFDIHHGNGTQNIFWTDDNILFCSIHRFSEGFFPQTGNYNEIGANIIDPDGQKHQGEGYTVNMPVPGCAYDYHYIMTFVYLFLPILSQFQPDLILISAGFDCLQGDPLGMMAISPIGLWHMTQALQAMQREGRVVAALEGGYHPETVAEGVDHITHALLGDTPPLDINQLISESQNRQMEQESTELVTEHNLEFIRTLQCAITAQQPYWSCLQDLPSLESIDTAAIVDLWNKYVQPETR